MQSGALENQAPPNGAMAVSATSNSKNTTVHQVEADGKSLVFVPKETKVCLCADIEAAHIS